uniref:Uncharacterized protein n=1 Tax=Cacopsylla melanoneura TaxID=428564 RepID=A0A8D8U3D8_9HEMI
MGYRYQSGKLKEATPDIFRLLTQISYLESYFSKYFFTKSKKSVFSSTWQKKKKKKKKGGGGGGGGFFFFFFFLFFFFFFFFSERLLKEIQHVIICFKNDQILQVLLRSWRRKC